MAVWHLCLLHIVHLLYHLIYVCFINDPRCFKETCDDFCLFSYRHVPLFHLYVQLQVGNSLVLSTAGPTPATPSAEGTQSSIAVTQQQLPVFRHPNGMPIPHYHPNYFPYGHYFPPFYVPPPSIHQFLSNGAFPQQPQAGSIYPAPPGATTKYSLPQYKAGNNTGNPAHVGVARKLWIWLLPCWL